MIDKLKPNERLVYAGKVALRAPDGTTLPAVPQYMIVPAKEAETAREVALQGNERLVVVGTVHNDKKRAEERFAELKAGRKPPQGEKGTPLYIKDGAEGVNPKTGLSHKEERAADLIIGDLLDAFAEYMSTIKPKGGIANGNT